MSRLLQQLPIQLGFIIPLVFLGEFLSHKEQLLAGVSHHIAQECTVRGKFFFLVLPAHFLEHGAFSIDDLVMGDRENVVFRETVEE